MKPQLQTDTCVHAGDLLESFGALDMDIHLAYFQHQGAHTGFDLTCLDLKLTVLHIPVAAVIPGIITCTHRSVAQLHARIFLRQFAAFDQRPCQILCGLLCEAAFQGLLLRFLFQLGNGLLRDRQLIMVDLVSRDSLKVFLFRQGKDSNRTVLALGNAGDLIVSVFAGCRQLAPIKHQIIANISSGAAVQLHFLKLFDTCKSFKIQILIINRQRAVLVEECTVNVAGGFIIHRHRQSLRQEDHILHTGNHILISTAMDAGDLHISNLSVHLAVFIEHTVIDGDHIVHRKTGAVIHKAAVIIVGIDGLQIGAEQCRVLKAKLFHLVIGQEDHIAVDPHIAEFTEVDCDIVIANLQGLHFSLVEETNAVLLNDVAFLIYHRVGIPVRGSDLVAATRLQAIDRLQRVDAVTFVCHRIFHFRIEIGDLQEGQSVTDLLLALSLHLNGEIRSHIQRRNIIQRSHTGNIRITLTLHHFGVKGQIGGHRVCGRSHLSQITVIIPAAEYIAILLRFGQGVDQCILRHRTAFRKGIRCILLLCGVGEGDLMVSRGGSTAAAFIRSTGGHRCVFDRCLDIHRLTADLHRGGDVDGLGIISGCENLKRHTGNQ